MYSCSDQSDEDSLSEKTPSLDVSFITTSAENSVVEEEPQDIPPQGGNWVQSMDKQSGEERSKNSSAQKQNCVSLPNGKSDDEAKMKQEPLDKNRFVKFGGVISFCSLTV